MRLLGAADANGATPAAATSPAVANKKTSVRGKAGAVGDSAQWLKEEDICELTLWEGNPIVVTPPNFVILEVTETSHILNNATERSLVIKVPAQLGHQHVDRRVEALAARS